MKVYVSPKLLNVYPQESNPELKKKTQQHKKTQALNKVAFIIILKHKIFT